LNEATALLLIAAQKKQTTAEAAVSHTQSAVILPRSVNCAGDKLSALFQLDK
jgi:hypothetical protein